MQAKLFASGTATGNLITLELIASVICPVLGHSIRTALRKRETGGSLGGDYEDYFLLGCDVV
jgi:hypothetical protein